MLALPRYYFQEQLLSIQDRLGPYRIWDDSLDLVDTGTNTLRLDFGIRGIVIEFVKVWAWFSLALEDVSSDPPWQDLEELVVHVGSCWHREYVIQLFQCSLLSLG